MSFEKPPFIEFRTDAFTQPTAEMVAEMAKIGYVYSELARECPQTRELEELGADLMGMEASVLVPSGTMANLAGLLALTKPGDEVVVEAASHIYNRERGGLAVVAGLVPRPVAGERGVLRPDAVRAAMRLEPTADTVNAHGQWSVLLSRTSLVCIENAHNESGNTVWTVDETRAICDLAHSVGATVHLDGARIFNAAVALDVPVRALTEPTDTVALGLAKGLAAPVGALLCGKRAVIERARVFRQMLGGAMHRPAWLSAAGLIALRQMPDQLREDHRNARLLAEGLVEVPGIAVDLTQVQTNTVLFTVTHEKWTAPELRTALADQGVQVSARGERRVRMITHHRVGKREIGIFLECLRKVLATRPA